MGDRSNRNWFGPTPGGTSINPGGIWLPCHEAFFGTSSSFSVNQAVNQGYGFQFKLRATTTFNQCVSFQTVGVTAGANFYIGIYDISGNLLVTMKFATVGAVGIIVGSVVFGLGTTLPPGDYYFVFAIDTAAIADSIMGINTANLNMYNMMNNTAIRIGHFVGAISGGALVAKITPSTWTVDTSFASQSIIPQIFVNA